MTATTRTAYGADSSARGGNELGECERQGLIPQGRSKGAGSCARPTRSGTQLFECRRKSKSLGGRENTPPARSPRLAQYYPVMLKLSLGSNCSNFLLLFCELLRHQARGEVEPRYPALPNGKTLHARRATIENLPYNFNGGSNFLQDKSYRNFNWRRRIEGT